MPILRGHLRRHWPALLASAAVLSVLGTTRGEDAAYLFYMRRELEHLVQNEPQKVVGQKVVFTDELVVLWPDVQQRKNKLEGKQFALFDTALFSCAVPTTAMGDHLGSIWQDAQKGYQEALTKIEEVNEQERTRQISSSQANDMRRELYWELYRVWSNKPVLTIFGQVQRADLWGPVRGKEAGVATESITIIVDRVEKPRRRWYLSLDE